MLPRMCVFLGATGLLWRGFAAGLRNSQTAPSLLHLDSAVTRRSVSLKRGNHQPSTALPDRRSAPQRPSHRSLPALSFAPSSHARENGASGSWGAAGAAVAVAAIFGAAHLRKPPHANGTRPGSNYRGGGDGPRPQLVFDPPLDNSDAPFRVKIYTDGKLSYGEPGVHRFEKEIRGFVPSARQLECGPDRPPAPLAASPVEWIDTPETLQSMERILSAAEEVAVDLEAHDHRSFQGFTCLLQFSTRDQDFLVDTLKLRDQLHCLNDFFTNPAITKVMHSAGQDVERLQRDFGIYIVNLFDTSCACEVQGAKSVSLKSLLERFCNVSVNKSLQTADWRQRPLSLQMLQYAREDTHYLLYIHDRLKRQLVEEKGTPGLEECYKRSKTVCLRQYLKPGVTDVQVRNFLKRRASKLNAAQREVAKALLHWRDGVARTLDESVGYVLPGDMLVNIARTMPTTVDELLRCCKPNSVPSPLQREAQVVLGILKKARLAKMGAPASSDF